ncbi:MAG: ATP-binding cassette domain-containing protein [Roseiflexaceae bacterium]|nr:ATP-binding cassette domain-containing protein [Roseiflexaceae bacterium]
MIEAQSLHKAFGKVVAVEDVSFRALDGRITGILGPNGAGKSTALRMLTGLMRPDRGMSCVDGADVVRDPVKAQRQIGVLPDSIGLYPRLSARENISYFGQLTGVPPRKLETQISELATLLEMNEFLDRRAEGFSQGQRLKVAIARSLIHAPQNIILDEPTNGLDVMSTRAMREIIRRFRDQGRCVLFSSHIMQEVAALCDWIVVIARGRVVAQGTPDDLRRTTGQANLEDAFVAAIGSGEGLML